MSFEIDELLALQPFLYAFAVKTSRSRIDADDLVQETMCRALVNREKFAQGTNLQAWTATILRNVFFDQCNKLNRERKGNTDGLMFENVTIAESQEWHVQLLDLNDAIATLPDHLRATLYRVVFHGDDYETAAEILGCPLGTVKSRINRIRQRLAKYAPE